MFFLKTSWEAFLIARFLSHFLHLKKSVRCSRSTLSCACSPAGRARSCPLGIRMDRRISGGASKTGDCSTSHSFNQERLQQVFFFPELLQQISYKFWFVLKNSLKNSPSALLSDKLNAKGETKS